MCIFEEQVGHKCKVKLFSSGSRKSDQKNATCFFLNKENNFYFPPQGQVHVQCRGHVLKCQGPVNDAFDSGFAVYLFLYALFKFFCSSIQEAPSSISIKLNGPWL